MVPRLTAFQLDRQERVPQFAAQRVEAGTNKLVAGVAQPENLAASGRPRLDHGEIGRRQVEIGSCRLSPYGKRTRWLTEHGCNDVRLDHHGQCEAARETHANRTDAGSAQLFVKAGGQGTQPYGDGRRLVQRQCRKLLRHADLRNNSGSGDDRGFSARFTEQRRHHHGHTRRDHSISEGDDRRRDARDLGHHDDTRTGTAAIRGVGTAIGRE